MHGLRLWTACGVHQACKFTFGCVCSNVVLPVSATNWDNQKLTREGRNLIPTLACVRKELCLASTRHSEAGSRARKPHPCAAFSTCVQNELCLVSTFLSVVPAPRYVVFHLARINNIHSVSSSISNVSTMPWIARSNFWIARSNHVMLEAAWKQQKKLNLLLSGQKPSIKANLLSEEEWKSVSRIVTLLELLETGTLEFSYSLSPNLHLAVPAHEQIDVVLTECLYNTDKVSWTRRSLIFIECASL